MRVYGYVMMSHCCVKSCEGVSVCDVKLLCDRYEDGQVNSHVDMKRDSDIKMVEVALAKSFMPVVPQLRTHMEMVDQVDKGSSS